MHIGIHGHGDHLECERKGPEDGARPYQTDSKTNTRRRWICNRRVMGPTLLLAVDAEVIVEHSYSAVCIDLHMHGLVN